MSLIVNAIKFVGWYTLDLQNKYHFKKCYSAKIYPS